MNISIITLFPGMFDTLRHGIMGRALEKKLIHLHFLNPRDFADDAHKTVDDRPFGGGPGMVMTFNPLRRAIAEGKRVMGGGRVIYVSPQGRRFMQSHVRGLLANQRLIFIAGRYEGLDQRLIDLAVDEQWSIGDYILNGGELAVMVMLETMARLLPGVLGNDSSAEQDSFTDGLLDYPHYTRPAIVDGYSVPEVLLSGDHAAISRWRKKQSLGFTYEKRPDLLEKLNLTDEQTLLLNEYILEKQAQLGKSFTEKFN